MLEPLPRFFDQQISHEAREFLTDLLLKHPELRSVAVICDYNGPLSKAPGLERAVWVGPVSPDSTVGMMRVTNGFQEHLVGVGRKIVEGIEEKILEVGNRYLQQAQVQPTSPTAMDGHGTPTPATGEKLPDVQGKPPSPPG